MHMEVLLDLMCQTVANMIKGEVTAALGQLMVAVSKLHIPLLRKHSLFFMLCNFLKHTTPVR
jgi:hypothetical protein